MFNGLRRALSAIALVGKRFIGSQGTSTNAPRELDVIPGKREARDREHARTHGLPSEWGQRFPIKQAARRSAIRSLRGYGLKKATVRDVDALAATIEKDMRDAWETRVDDGILARAGNK